MLQKLKDVWADIQKSEDKSVYLIPTVAFVVLVAVLLF